MTTVFKVLNPLTGLYIDSTSESERNSILFETAWNFYLSHTHNSPYSQVVINEDGSETWTAPNGTPQLSPAEIQKLIADEIAKLEQQ